MENLSVNYGAISSASSVLHGNFADAQYRVHMPILVE